MKLSIKKLAEQIEVSNEEFNNMSKADKRVQIARDCLDRIKLKQFEPWTGRTCDIDFNFICDNGEKSIKEILAKKKLPDCHACAKGGLFLSYVGRTNKFNFEDIEDSSNLESTEMQKLLEIFDKIQLEGIETAFEKYIVSTDYLNINDWEDDFDGNQYEFISNCMKYSDNTNCSTNTERLQSICKNIIKNKGEFVPTDYVKPNAKIK